MRKIRLAKLFRRPPLSLALVTLLTILIGSFFTMGCTNSRVVQPLNNNQWQVAVNLGGPIIKKDGYPQTIPLSSVSVAYGYTQNLTGFAGIHPSTALHGIYQMDVGFSHELLAPFHFRPGITYSASLNGFISRGNSQTKFYPQLDINSYWLLPFRNDYFYIGMSNWFELSGKKAHQQTQETRWLPSIHTGYALQFDRYGVNFELKYLAPLTNNQNLLVDYYSPTKTGSLGVYVAVSRKF